MPLILAQIKNYNKMNKLFFGLAILSFLAISCDSDDDNNTRIIPDAGILQGGPFTFCVDGELDFVNGISTDANSVGTNSTFVITDESGNILGLPPTLEALGGVDFDEAGPGICLIWYLRYENGIQGLEPGENASNLSGSFDLSNSITVDRRGPNGGTIAGGPFNFTVDGMPDMVSGISLDGTQMGTNRSWVITDDQGNILGLPPTLNDVENVNFDDAGVGVCLIWYLRYEDGLEGATVGANANFLEGCFSLSNPIIVNRL